MEIGEPSGFEADDMGNDDLIEDENFEDKTVFSNMDDYDISKLKYQNDYVDKNQGEKLKEEKDYMLNHHHTSNFINM